MKGIEGAKKYFELYGDVIKEQFPDFMKYAAFRHLRTRLGMLRI